MCPGKTGWMALGHVRDRRVWVQTLMERLIRKDAELVFASISSPAHKKGGNWRELRMRDVHFKGNSPECWHLVGIREDTYTGLE